jgi:PadR family transcriptional regulator PadR
MPASGIDRDYKVGIPKMADHLGAFEQAVLLAVVRLGEEAYGRAILKEVQTRLERDVAAGAVHATLDRLGRKGVVSSRLGPGTPVRGVRAPLLPPATRGCAGTQ